MNPHTISLFHENAFENVAWKLLAFCLGHNVLSKHNFYVFISVWGKIYQHLCVISDFTSSAFDVGQWSANAGTYHELCIYTVHILSCFVVTWEWKPRVVMMPTLLSSEDKVSIMTTVNCRLLNFTHTSNGYLSFKCPGVTETTSRCHIYLSMLLCGQWPFVRYWPFVWGIHRSPVTSQRPVTLWCGALMISFICARINGSVNNREAGDLRRHRVHYDVIVMNWLSQWQWSHPEEYP